ncbi:MAG TPA: cell division protein FtsL [Geobacteraceae bacterium]
MANAKVSYGKVAAPRIRKIDVMLGRRTDLFPYLMVVMVLLTLVSIFHVWSRVKVIDMNLQIAEITRQIKEQEQEQNRLKLEVASLKTPARIEALARGELGMALPTEQQMVIVK